MATVEKRRSELKVGDILLTKTRPPNKLVIKHIMPGAGGEQFPYLTLTTPSGDTREHDTWLDPISATFTVLLEELTVEEKLKKFMAKWLEETSRKTRAVGEEDPKTEPRIEGMEFAIIAISKWMEAGCPEEIEG